MAVDMFLLFASGANIVGESQDSDPALKNKAIDLLTYRWGLWNPAVLGAYRQGVANAISEHWQFPKEPRDIQNLWFTKNVDGATVNLVRACHTNLSISKATLILRKAGGKDALQYCKYTMEKVVVDMVTSTGGGEDELPIDTVLLRFQKYEVNYTPQKADGSGGPEQSFSGDWGATK